MDLVETTLKVAENQNAARENLARFKEEQKQYENYVDKLKENIKKTQSSHSQSQEILEVNNFTKTVFNENLKVIRDMFGKVYNYSQEIQDKLSKITEQEGPLEQLYNENEGHYTTLHSKLRNNLRDLEIIENNTNQKLSQENSQLLQQIDETKSVFIELNESWKSIIDEHDEKYQALKSVILENEHLNDQIESMEREENDLLLSIQLKKEESQKEFDEIINEVESVENKIRECEEYINETSAQLNEQLKLKEEISRTENEELRIFEKLQKDCLDLENDIADTEDKSSEKIQELTAATESTTKLVKESQSELLVCEKKSFETTTEIEQLQLKNKTLNEEIEKMNAECETSERNKTESLKKIEKLINENEQLLNDSNKIKNNITEHKNQISNNEKYLEELKSKLQLELNEINDKEKTSEFEFLGKQTELEHEIQANDFENKQLQHHIEKLQANLKDFKLKQVQLENQKDQNYQKLKGIANQCRIASSEIKRLETSKAESVRLMPTPSLKKVPQTKKRKPNVGSDSSLDGEVDLSYAEYMKRMMGGAK